MQGARAVDTAAKEWQARNRATQVTVSRSYRYGQVTMKKFPSIRSLYQSAARSERQSKTKWVPRPASSITLWICAVNVSNPTSGRNAWISAPIPDRKSVV